MKGSFVTTQAYFDCNATTSVLPAAAQAALEAMRTLYGNPSSAHLVGLQARFILETTRKTSAKVVGALPEQIIFTSGATEGIQTAVFSALQDFKARSLGGKTKLLYGATEHKAIPQALHHWVKALDLPFEIFELPVDASGQIKPDVLREQLPHAALVCTMAVNNETGVIQDLKAIEKILNETQSKALWLVDCVQALGKLEIQLNFTRIDYAPFSGHKIYAPKGIGFLYVKKGSPFTPLIVGGGQEKGLRSGTENLPGVAALGAVLECLLDSTSNSPFYSHAKLKTFRDKIVAELKAAFPKVEFNMPFEKSVPTTLNFSVPGFSSAELLDLFDSAGLRVSAGSACSATSVKPSHVLDAMGVPLWKSTSAIRLSFGPNTSEQEIDRGCQIIRECAVALKNTCLMDTASAFEAPESLRDGILQFRAGSTNSWILADRTTRNCVVIDPSETVAERIEQYIRCQNLTILAVLDTHSHGDHESIRPVLQKILADHLKKQPGTNFDGLGWPNSTTQSLPTVQLDNGSVVPMIQVASSKDGDLVLARMQTPGHTNDSTALLFGTVKSGLLKKEDIHFAFPGDTVLSGGLGRTNFSVSNPKDLFESLRSLQDVLSPTTLLCPAHDYNNSFATSLKAEVAGNSLLALALAPMTPLTQSVFLERKSQVDLELANLEKDFQGVVCGVTPSSIAGTECAIALPPSRLEEYFSNKKEAPIVVDVREPQEFVLFKDWAALGLKETPRNIPLSRFVNFMSELISTHPSDQEVLLICKSGTRSFQAAKSLRSLGFTRVWNLDGGVALAGQA